MVETFLKLPGWESPRWILVGFLVVVLAGLLQLDRWAADRQARFREAQVAARREAGRRRGEVMRQTRPVPRSGPRAPSLLNADQRQLIATIRSLQARLDEANLELSIRREPDPILRALLVGPLSLSQIAATIGEPVTDVDRRCKRLLHITEQIERVQIGGRGDWKYALPGSGSARESGKLPARGKAG